MVTQRIPSMFSLFSPYGGKFQLEKNLPVERIPPWEESVTNLRKRRVAVRPNLKKKVRINYGYEKTNIGNKKLSKIMYENLLW